MATLNANHARRIASTFTHVDELLRNVERLAHGRASSFASERPDLSETESRLLLSLVETARARMLATLDHLGIPRPRAKVSARWSVVTAFRFVDTALSELTEETLRGYGVIDADSASEVNAVASELRELAKRGDELLRPHEGEKLRERLVNIEGPLGEVLRAAEELSTRLGFVEVRTLIAAAADRAVSSTIDIGVFGRVSSGKSSLINALVGAPLLPVGATPVTAVPLRVIHGPDRVQVFYMDGRDEVIGAERLPEFATETGNRDNVRRVQSLLVVTPSLADGLALLDTPGVGSLSQSGPAQAYAWLPRCDVGVVLVAAGTPLGQDELALVNGLSHAGIAVEVLLSKSDLIPESERESAIDYVQRDLTRSTGTANIRVRAVSVVPPTRLALDQWRDDRLLPMIAARQHIAAAARTRRVRALLGALSAGTAGLDAMEPSTVALWRVQLEAQQEIGATADALDSSASDTLAEAADAVVIAWRARADAQVAARDTLARRAHEALDRMRSIADRVLDGSSEAGSDDVGGRIPPLFDAPFLDALPFASPPSVVDRLFAHSQARHDLSKVERDLKEAYSTYASRLRAWGSERLRENVERVRALQPRVSGQVTAEMRGIAALIETHFPEAGQ